MALARIADYVDVIDTSFPLTIWYRIAYHLFLCRIPVRLPDTKHVNITIRNYVTEKLYDIIWIDKGLTITKSTMRFIKACQPNALIVSFSPDNMMARPWQSQQYLECIPLYDYHVTTKPYIINDFYKKGAKKVVLVNKTFQPDFHYPRLLNDSDFKNLSADVGFVGSWEKERCESILYLADNGVHVKVFGSGKWKNYRTYSKYLEIIPNGLYDDDYAKSFSAFKISLCFLKKSAKDITTARSVEIPACGGFMLAERTEEHKILFEEDIEAVYFSSNEELLEKCKYYLEHEDERKAIAVAGYKRCINSDYSNEGMISGVLDQIFSESCGF